MKVFRQVQKESFACGNVLHVHDLVDFVSEELFGGKTCRRICKRKAEKQKTERKSWENCTLIGAGEKIRYTVPSFWMYRRWKKRLRYGSVYQMCWKIGMWKCWQMVSL